MPLPTGSGSGQGDQADLANVTTEDVFRVAAGALVSLVVQHVVQAAMGNVVQAYPLTYPQQAQSAGPKRLAGELLSTSVVVQDRAGAGNRVELRDSRLPRNRPGAGDCRLFRA